MLLNCGAGEDSWESLGLQGDHQWTLKEINLKHSLKYAEADPPIPWPPDAKSWLIGKDPDTGKEWRQKEKRVAENEMVG